MYQHIQQLEIELENTKEALRRSNKTSSTQQASDIEGGGGDIWNRFGANNVVCYVPLTALYYWRRWRGRADDHTSE